MAHQPLKGLRSQLIEAAAEQKTRARVLFLICSGAKTNFALQNCHWYKRGKSFSLCAG
jgi:hypothetical protein